MTFNAGGSCSSPTTICNTSNQAIGSRVVIAVPGPGTQPGVLSTGTSGENVFEIEGSRIQESTGTATFTVSLAEPSAARACVAFTTINGTTRSGSDYVSHRETLIFEHFRNLADLRGPLHKAQRRAGAVRNLRTALRSRDTPSSMTRVRWVSNMSSRSPSILSR